MLGVSRALRLVSFFVVAFLASSPSAFAREIFLDFEDRSDLEVIEEQYSGLGIEFTGSPFIVTDSANTDPKWPPASGTKQGTAGPIVNIPTVPGAVLIDFAVPPAIRKS